MSKLKSYRRCVITSPHAVEEIIDVLARARRHLSNNHRAVCAELIHQAENKLNLLGKEDINNESSNLRGSKLVE